jgi:nucleoid DNA-binding protein
VEASAWAESIHKAVGWLSERQHIETWAGSAQFATVAERDGAATGLHCLEKQIGRLLARTDEKRDSTRGRTWSLPRRRPAEGSRDQWVVALQERGFSFRQARKLVQVIWQVITDALRRGESVETPLGIFRVVSSPPLQTRFRRGRLQTLFRNRRRILFKGIVL